MQRPPEPATVTPPRIAGAAFAHDSAVRHVCGSAVYVDDIRAPEGTLHVAVRGSPVARGRVRRLVLDDVRAAAGVVAVLTAADIPGRNDVSPVKGDDPMFAELKARVPALADAAWALCESSHG